MAVIDLDDTLLSEDKQITPANLAALATLRLNNFEIVVASGRHHENIMSYRDRIGQQGWVISSNGAVVRHSRTSEILHEFTLTLEQALDVCRYGAERDLTIIGYHKNGAFIERETEWTRLYAQKSGWQPKLGKLAYLAVTGLQKLLLTDLPERIDAVQLEAEKRFGSDLYVVRTEDEILEIAAPKTNKALGAQTVARALGIETQNVVAFGDGNNDVELLRWAGSSVAMSHGRERARKAAKLVSTPGCNGTAFARAVQAVLERSPSGRGSTKAATLQTSG